MRLKPSYILIMILRFKTFKNSFFFKPLQIKQSLEKIKEEEEV